WQTGKLHRAFTRGRSQVRPGRSDTRAAGARMAQTQTAANTYITPAVAVTKRISLPFLRVQERKWLLGTVDLALALVWIWGSYELWRAFAHPARNNMAQVPWEWILGGALVWILVSWLAGAYELETADRFWKPASITFTVRFVAALGSFVAYY